MFNLGAQRHLENAPLFRHGHNLIVDIPVAVSLMGHDSGPVPGGTLLVDVIPRNHPVGGVFPADNPNVGQVVRSDDFRRVEAGHMLGVV